MKIVFLDFDGVIVTRHTEYRRGYAPCIEQLNYIIQETKAEIVISSSWRFVGLLPCKDDLNRWGVKATVKDVTGVDKIARGFEIGAYLNKLEKEQIKVENFVILDDDDDMGDLTPHLVQTNIEKGLTREDAEKAISILNER